MITTKRIELGAIYTPCDVSELIPGTSQASLAQMRARGQGPAYIQHTPHGRVLYRGSDLIAWLDAGVRSPADAIA